ncbi:uncharacterized protein PHALS_00508 [Plasmopara halstedii]|uniref:Uncharacterized protein n=1 Tax=Plasmopara halstedii TaxID=4781 RepID=A0A0P1A7L6_PLAHL|nr:uncharacterized protein PHALS_00508 [Plasmopara halstedii]CEG36186.1 hypothetical protein PHALS_00508 [Plasmopara halstedii]|eukprot:XP_024572555.1 hypothetical protein PHALS_00508 [Plasmopara halstedii]
MTLCTPAYPDISIPLGVAYSHETDSLSIPLQTPRLKLDDAYIAITWSLAQRLKTTDELNLYN